VNQQWIGILSLLIVIASALLVGVFAFLHRKKATITFREIPAFSRLRRAVGLSVEDGTRIHISIGRGALTDSSGASAFAALNALERISEQTSLSDYPPVATSGNAAFTVLAQDSLKTAYQKAGAEDQFDVTAGRLTGLTPFSYAAGAMPVIRDEKVSVNIFLGHFGLEIALLTDTAERSNAFVVSGSDNLPAQAVLFASSPDALVGEELYATSAYIKPTPVHTASLQTQDILRWVIAAAILIGAALKVVGVL
jgi:hypothetical protein